MIEKLSVQNILSNGATQQEFRVSIKARRNQQIFSFAVCSFQLDFTMNGWNKLIEDNVNANAAINVGELLKPAPPALLVQMPNGPPLSATEFVQSFDPLNNDNTLEVTLNITRVANVARSATGLPVSTILVTTADGHVIQVKGWRDQAHNTTNQCRVDRKMTIDFLRCQSVTSNFNDGQFLCELVASTRTEFSDLGVALTVSDLPIKTTLNEINTHLGRQIGKLGD